MGISVRISLALAVIAAIALLASGAAILFLHEFDRNYQAMSRQNVPAIIAAARLLGLTQRLIAEAPAIVMAENQIIRQDIMRDVAQGELRKDRILKDLRTFGVAPQTVNDISRSFDALLENLKRLNQVATDVIAINADIQSALLRLTQLSNILEDAASIAPEAALVFNRQVTLLLRLQIELNSERLRKLEQRFASLHETAERLELSSELQAIHREIAYLGSGGRNLFTSHAQHIELQTEIAANLNQNRFISAELGNKTNRLFETVSAEIDRQRDLFDRRTRQLALLIFSIPLMTLIGTFAIHWHIRQSVIRRILDLERCMHSQIEGPPLPVTVSGHDEISSMAQAAAYFIDTRNAHEANLNEAKNAAEAANRAKSAFLAHMSHELRTPLNGILGYAQILRRQQDLRADMQNGLNIIYQSGNHLLTLINDILDLSKIEAGKLELYSVEMDVAGFLSGLIGMIRIRAQEKNVGFETQLDPQLPPIIRADEKRLRQVLLNLLGNAVKFTNSGGAVTFRVSLIDNCQLRFEISDTGVGMTPEHLQQLFEPFVQAGDALRRAEGTGLGLAISQQLVNLMGSAIQVTSAPGQGSTFWFEAEFPTSALTTSTLPVRQEEAVGDAADADAEIVPPPRADLETLHELAALGRVFEIQEYVEQIETQDARYQPFARKIWAMAQAFEDHQIAALVKQYLEDLR